MFFLNAPAPDLNVRNHILAALRAAKVKLPQQVAILCEPTMVDLLYDIGGEDTDWWSDHQFCAEMRALPVKKALKLARKLCVMHERLESDYKTSKWETTPMEIVGLLVPDPAVIGLIQHLIDYPDDGAESLAHLIVDVAERIAELQEQHTKQEPLLLPASA